MIFCSIAPRYCGGDRSSWRELHAESQMSATAASAALAAQFDVSAERKQNEIFNQRTLQQYQRLFYSNKAFKCTAHTHGHTAAENPLL